MTYIVPSPRFRSSLLAGILFAAWLLCHLDS